MSIPFGFSYLFDGTPDGLFIRDVERVRSDVTPLYALLYSFVAAGGGVDSGSDVGE